MLILTRKKDESIIIDGNIEVKILSADDGRVRIGIDAPKTVELYRKEVFDKIEEQNKKSTISASSLNQLKKFIKK